MVAKIRILNEHEKKTIQDLYELGIPLYSLRALFHTTIVRVREALVEAGVEIRDTSGFHRKTSLVLSPDQGAIVLDLLKCQVGLMEIVKRTGFNGRSVVLYARTTPWWARCEKCGETLRNCAEWFWKLERGGLCGKCASGDEDFKATVSSDFREGFANGWIAALYTLRKLTRSNGLWGTAWEKARRHWEEALLPWQGRGYDSTWPPELK